jgi:6-phosphogluconolactonase (cycloisomerase 2 family)
MPEQSAARFAYVGCRTTRERNARGSGIQVYQVMTNGDWRHVQLVTGLENPSFLAFDRTQNFLYAVHGDFSDISAFSINATTGRLTLLNRQSTEGRNPAHLLVESSNRYVLVANYATGTVAVLPRLEDGTLAPVRQVIATPGAPGPHKVDQTFAHPHEITYAPDRRFLLVPDKGLDRVFTYRFDAELGQLSPGEAPFVQVRPGAGPRHIAFHPGAAFAYVAHELDSSVGAYRYDADDGALTPLQIMPSLPDDFVGANTTSEIAVTADGRFLFISNRGHDSIASFAIDQTTGRLTQAGWTHTQGQGPRFFEIDPQGARLYAANETSDSIVAFDITPDTGALTPSGMRIDTASPTCIVFSTEPA